ncbi:hypothetical protein M514_02478 [Trichuris suis]|uniref:Uncharacterized protein n=1 Tax=Trichuris suis TaxID=68888 RepID=A0A085MHV5_9BILA|nr:hypothetical protein M513_02478 [Trichuris suis]KFD68147.1 hypothetical protein M514_02478 [Trichuris suis]
MIGLPGYKELGHSPCKPTNQLLKFYGGQQVPINDSLTVTVQCGSRSRELLVQNRFVSTLKLT